MGGNLSREYYDDKTKNVVSALDYFNSYGKKGIEDLAAEICEGYVKNSELIKALGGENQIKCKGEMYAPPEMSDDSYTDGLLVFEELQFGVAEVVDGYDTILANRVNRRKELEKLGFRLVVVDEKKNNKQVTSSLTSVAECKSFAKQLQTVLIKDVGINPIVAEATVIKKMSDHIGSLSTGKYSDVDVKKEFKVFFAETRDNVLTLDIHTFNFTSRKSDTKNVGWISTSHLIEGEFSIVCKSASLECVPLKTLT